MTSFRCPDGSSSNAALPSIALMYWYGRSVPSAKIENPEILKLYVGNPLPASPYDAMFLPLVLAACERETGKTPTVTEIVLEEEFYLHLPKELNFPKMVQLRNRHPSITLYEEQCSLILMWLADHGVIIDYNE